MSDQNMTMTEACRLNFHYTYSYFDNIKDAYRTQAWLWETFGLPSEVEADGNKFYVNVDVAGGIVIKFSPQTASIRHWNEWLRKAAGQRYKNMEIAKRTS
jgi:hypothetical protein